MGRTFHISLVMMFWGLLVNAQTETFQGLDLVQDYLRKGTFDKAETAINQQIASLRQAKSYSELIFYGYFLGKIELEKGNTDLAIRKSDAFIEDFKKNAQNPHNTYEALLDLAWLHDEIGDIQRAYEMNLEAQEYCLRSPDCSKENQGLLQYNLGARILDLGNLAQAKIYLRNALNRYLEHPGITEKRLYQAYNALGAVAYQSSQMDSALYYFDLSLEKVDNSDYSVYEKTRQKMYIYANMADAYAEQGNIQKSNQMFKDNIDNYQLMIDSTRDLSLAFEARRIIMSSWSGIAANYLELGDIEKSYEVSKYTYETRKKYLQASDPDIIKSLNDVGAAAARLHRYEEARSYFHQAISKIDSIPGDYLYQDAAAHSELGKVLFQLEEPAEGRELLDKAQKLYRQALQEDYNPQFIIFLRESSLLHAQFGDSLSALETARLVRDITRSNQGEFSLAYYKQTINLAEVYFQLKDYARSLEALENAREINSQLLAKSNSLTDSIQIRSLTPRAVFLQCAAEFRTQTQTNKQFLISLLQRIDRAIKNLEVQKSFIISTESIGIIQSNNKELFELAKAVALRLYEQTGQVQYLDRVISMHESNIYSRIRSRLNTRKAITFSGIPSEISVREQQLKQRLTSALVQERQDQPHQIKSFLTANEEWAQLMLELRTNYPKYYHTRYASILVPMDQLAVPQGTTLVRYMFIGEQLYAMVIHRNGKQLFRLDQHNLRSFIEDFNSGTTDIQEVSDLLIKLYQQLWLPFEDQIVGNKLVIVPDGDLFNLSFEMLTPRKISNYQDMASESLMSTYSISYNYSSLLLEDLSNQYHKDLVAFAPGFSKNMKNSYQTSIKDTLAWDKTYLTLLSQPFSLDLANMVHHLYSGELFMEEKSTERNFKEQAGNHKIIHIGTHAESDNHRPELSRLIFAKDVNSSNLEEDNSLYAYEIYSCELGSNLTVLTACETGRPSYQAGEGMISLAHAFNYAGSESLLTSLWKIDEQSSAKIVEIFYRNLLKGMEKDEALKAAKLAYLEQAQGRTAHPQYWAGLIIMGDVSPLELDKKRPWWQVALGLLLVTGIIVVVRQFLIKALSEK